MTKAKGKGSKFVPAADKSGWMTPADEPQVLRGKAAKSARTRGKSTLTSEQTRDAFVKAFVGAEVVTRAEVEGGSAPRVARAHPALKPGAPPLEARIDEILERMRSFTWVRGASAKELAERWGVAVNTVENLAAEASRVIKRELRDNTDGVTADITIALSHIMQSNVHGGFKEQGVAVKAAEVWAKLTGAMAPTRTELSGPGGKPVEVAAVDLTEQQAEDEVLRLADEIRARRAKEGR